MEEIDEVVIEMAIPSEAVTQGGLLQRRNILKLYTNGCVTTPSECKREEVMIY